MIGEPGTKGSAHTYGDEELAWIGQRLDELRPLATGPHFLYWSLAIGFVLGLAVHAAGYLLRSSAAGEPFGLAVELMSALGLALWTGVVVVLFVQVIPQVKRRHLEQAVGAYDAWRRKRSRRGRRRTSSDGGPSGSQRPS